MLKFNNIKEFVMFSLFRVVDSSISWKTMYKKCRTCAQNLENDEAKEDPLVRLTAARLLAAVYEVYHLVAEVGVYSNDRMACLENEMARIIEEAVGRGLLNDACVPEEEVRKYIDISPGMARLLWPKETRELMDIRDALLLLVP